MKRFKVFEDFENDARGGKPQQKCRKRLALGEIKNTIMTRSRYSELNEGLKRIKIEDQAKQKSKKRILPKKDTVKRKECEHEMNKSPQIKRKRRISSLFRVSEYANDIYKYLQRIEDKYPIGNSESVEDLFGDSTRFKLVDWLVQINEHFQFVHETLQICVSIIDRYVKVQDSLTRKDLGLIAMATVFIASKYEELVPIEVSELLQVVGSSMSTEEVLKMEMKIAKELQYSFGRPVPANFVRRYCKVGHASRVEQSCAFYLTDVALMSYKLSHFKPSIIAASALFIALCVSKGSVDRNLWNLTLVKYSTYQIEESQDCTKALARCLRETKSSIYQAIEEKYSKPMYFNVTEIPELLKVIDIIAM